MCFKLIRPSLGAERVGYGFSREEKKITWVSRAGAHICHPCLRVLINSAENLPLLGSEKIKEF
jgi:hypothetical protein